jgi:flagellar biosynthesis/type III secretory pathway M-ring protein FliF/YscJ
MCCTHFPKTFLSTVSASYVENTVQPYAWFQLVFASYKIFCIFYIMYLMVLFIYAREYKNGVRGKKKNKEEEEGLEEREKKKNEEERG